MDFFFDVALAAGIIASVIGTAITIVQDGTVLCPSIRVGGADRVSV